MANEEAVVAVELSAEPKAKKTKEPKAKKPKAATKAAPSHPPYAEMITDAIATLKERTGSSQHAITKFVELKHKSLPANFRKLLLGNLRKLVASGKVTKVKGSFKLPSAADKKNPTAISVAAKPKADKETTKPKKTPTKTKAVVATKPKAKAVTKPKAKAVTKPKAKAVSKPKPPAKAARTSTRSTPGKKAVVPKKAVTKKAGAPKKVKSPVKKAAAGARKAKK